MSELLVLKKSHWASAHVKSEIDAADYLLGSYVLRQDVGFVVDSRPNGTYRTPTNPKGKPWNGVEFVLIIVPDEDVKKIGEYNTKKLVTVDLTKRFEIVPKDMEIPDDAIDIEETAKQGTKETWGLHFPGAIYENQECEIITVTKDKLKLKKVDYSKSDKIHDKVLTVKAKG